MPQQDLTKDRPAPRVVLLGASNLARGISIAVETARLVCGGRAEFLVALGHGRSYAAGTCLLGRWLPGILPCGLWERLQREERSRERDADRPPTYALVTDIGNDILYGATPDQVVGWVRECGERLERIAARVVVTQLPVMNLPRLGPRKYEIMRRCMFPTCSLSLSEVVARALEVDVRIKNLAVEKNFFSVQPQADWYGWDPIHIRRSRFVAAWQAMLAPWRDDRADATLPRGSLRRWLYLHSRVPEFRKLWFYEQRGGQPCGRLRDGSLLWWY